MAFTEPPPPLWDATKSAVGPDGKLTSEFLQWLNRVLAYLARMGAAIP
jgi:hypothetical protein